MGILEFMSDSPVLTSFLVIALGVTIVETARALKG